MKYRFQGREKLLTFGSFPSLSLAQARLQRDAARARLRERLDPSTGAAAEPIGDGGTFEEAARSWHAHQAPRWTEVHAGDVLSNLERDAFPVMGALPLDAITPPAVLKALRRVEARGSAETARRLRQRISAVFAFAISEGAQVSDPAAIVRKALAPADVVRRQPALLDLDDARELLAATEAAPGALVSKLASRFLALTAVRLAAVTGAEWSEFDDVDWTGERMGPSRPTWRVPAARMKLAKAKKADAAHDHLVPLSREAVAVLLEARARAGHSRFVFPGRGGDAPLGAGAIGQLYARTRFSGKHVPHGWRATFSTLLNERFPADRSAIDQALAHAPKDKVEAAYNRAQHLARRRWILQAWGSMLC